MGASKKGWASAHASRLLQWLIHSQETRHLNSLPAHFTCRKTEPQISTWHAQSHVIKEAMWKWRSRSEGCFSIPRNIKDCQQSLERTERRSITPVVQTPGGHHPVCRDLRGKQDHTYHLFCLTLSVLMEMNWNQTRSLHLTRCSCALECGLPSQPTHEENQC